MSASEEVTADTMKKGTLLMVPIERSNLAPAMLDKLRLDTPNLVGTVTVVKRPDYVAVTWRNVGVSETWLPMDAAIEGAAAVKKVDLDAFLPEYDYLMGMAFAGQRRVRAREASAVSTAELLKPVLRKIAKRSSSRKLRDQDDDDSPPESPARAKRAAAVETPSKVRVLKQGIARSESSDEDEPSSPPAAKTPAPKRPASAVKQSAAKSTTKTPKRATGHAASGAAKAMNQYLGEDDDFGDASSGTEDSSSPKKPAAPSHMPAHTAAAAALAAAAMNSAQRQAAAAAAAPAAAAATVTATVAGTRSLPGSELLPQFPPLPAFMIPGVPTPSSILGPESDAFADTTGCALPLSTSVADVSLPEGTSRLSVAWMPDSGAVQAGTRIETNLMQRTATLGGRLPTAPLRSLAVLDLYHITTPAKTAKGSQALSAYLRAIPPPLVAQALRFTRVSASRAHTATTDVVDGDRLLDAPQLFAFLGALIASTAPKEEDKITRTPAAVVEASAKEARRLQARKLSAAATMQILASLNFGPCSSSDAAAAAIDAPEWAWLRPALTALAVHMRAATVAGTVVTVYPDVPYSLASGAVPKDASKTAVPPLLALSCLRSGRTLALQPPFSDAAAQLPAPDAASASGRTPTRAQPAKGAAAAAAAGATGDATAAGTASPIERVHAQTVAAAALLRLVIAGGIAHTGRTVCIDTSASSVFGAAGLYALGLGSAGTVRATDSLAPTARIMSETHVFSPAQWRVLRANITPALLALMRCPPRRLQAVCSGANAGSMALVAHCTRAGTLRLMLTTTGTPARAIPRPNRASPERMQSSLLYDELLHVREVMRVREHSPHTVLRACLSPDDEKVLAAPDLKRIRCFLALHAAIVGNAYANYVESGHTDSFPVFVRELASALETATVDLRLPPSAVLVNPKGVPLAAAGQSNTATAPLSSLGLTASSDVLLPHEAPVAWVGRYAHAVRNAANVATAAVPQGVTESSFTPAPSPAASPSSSTATSPTSAAAAAADTAAFVTEIANAIDEVLSPATESADKARVKRLAVCNACGAMAVPLVYFSKLSGRKGKDVWACSPVAQEKLGAAGAIDKGLGPWACVNKVIDQALESL